jgi:hypothetical protein
MKILILIKISSLLWLDKIALIHFIQLQMSNFSKYLLLFKFDQSISAAKTNNLPNADN